MSTLLTLPSHLLERIRDLVQADLNLPGPLYAELEETVRQAERYDDGPIDLGQESDRPELPTVSDEILEKLARWADTRGGRRKLESKRLDPADYGLIALLAGTEVYMPAKQREGLVSSQKPDQPNPFLPSYMSPVPPSFGSEYRALTRQLATVFNILFSIFGCAGAVFVASTSGAGYSRETAVILAILAGMIVGLADGILVWIVSTRSDKERKEGRLRGIQANTGSAGLGPLVIEDAVLENDKLDQADETHFAHGAATGRTPEPIRKSIRLRRKQLGVEEDDM